MSFVRVCLLGNDAWGKQFSKRPANNPNRQRIWVLVYDNGAAGAYEYHISSELHDWAPTVERDRRASELGSNYKILIFESNPHHRGAIVPGSPVSVTDNVTVTVTNQRTNDKGSDTQPVVIVDEARFEQILKDVDNDELFDLLPKNDWKGG